MTINKAEKQRVTIERQAHGGDGVGHLEDGRVVFVPETLPGEVVDIKLMELKKSFGRGRITEVIEPSEERIEPDCPYFGECGGCQFWHTNYQNELKLKTEAGWEAISRISKVDLPEARVIAAPEDRRYRSRVVFHQKRAHIDRKTGRREPNKIGFYRERSKSLVDIEDCLITEPMLNEARRGLEPALRDVGDCDIILETADAQSVVVTLIPERNFRTKMPRSLKEFLQTLEHNPLIRGLRVVGPDEDVVFGQISVDADQILAEVPVDNARLGSGDFRQSYRQMNRRLVDEVTAMVEASGATSILELYCGSGNFSFAMPDKVEEIVGLESSPAAVESASGLARLAQLERHQFRVADLTKGLSRTAWADAQGFDLVLLDPPRTGAAEVCAELAESHHPTTLIYVACEPACLGRDLKTLVAGGWKVDTLTMLDLFPRTSHIETIALLSRPNA